MSRHNIWIAASDGNTTQVLAHLSEDPSLVNRKDENGYTPIHAAASYGHRELLRRLCTQHGGDANVTDDDGDTPLFACEDVATAKMLVEELGADWRVRNEEGKSAADTISEDGTFPEVAEYLRTLESSANGTSGGSSSNNSDGTNGNITTTNGIVRTSNPGPPPPGVEMDVRSVDMEESNMMLEPVDEEFRRRIEELASRPGDFSTEDKQRDLMNIITEAVHKHVYDDSSDGRETGRARR